MATLQSIRARVGATRLLGNHPEGLHIPSLRSGSPLLSFLFPSLVDGPALSLQRSAASSKILCRRSGLRRIALNVEPGSAQRKAVSQTQSAAIAEQIRSAALTPEEKADLTMSLGEVKWADEAHLAHVLCPLTTVPASSGADRKRRREAQKHLHILNYGDAAFWDSFLSPDSSAASKLQVLMNLAIRLGLRLPSEPTCKMLCSAWVAATHSPTEMYSMEQSTKKVLLSHVKRSFDALRKRSAEPTIFIEDFPTDPLVYLRDYPAMYRAAYIADAKPIPCKLDLAVLQAFDQSYGCRGSVRAPSFSGNPSGSQERQLVLSPKRNDGHGLERLASQFMSQMQSIAAAQNRILEMALTSQQGSLRAITNISTPRLESRRLAITDQAHAHIEFLGEEVETPSPAVVRTASPCTALVPRPRSPTIARPLVESPPPVPAVSAPEGATASELELMLDALAARKADALAARKAEKKQAKAEGSADSSSAPKQLAEAKPPAKAITKKRGKGRKGGKGGKVGRGIGSVAAAAAAEPEEQTAVSARGPFKRPAAAAAAGPPPKKSRSGSSGGTARNLARKEVLGCTKCRWSALGCGQCRREDYNGFRWNITSDA